MKADLEILTSLAKRRGFAYPSAEIYGGFQSTWDYGPLGVEMKRQIRELWWRAVVQSRDDVVGIEAAVITNPAVWRASGHVDHFTDPLVDCLECRARVRSDHIEDGACPSCGAVGRFTEERSFNLLFRTYVGPVEQDSSVAYLRPETAQGMFVNFENVLTSTRRRLPFGIAQIGRSYRNEITPGQFIFRTREFEQMEMEYFCDPPSRSPGTTTGRRSGCAGTGRRSASPRSCSACATTRPTSSRTTRRRRPTSSSASPGAGASSRASRTAATTTCARTPAPPAGS